MRMRLLRSILTAVAAVSTAAAVAAVPPTVTASFSADSVLIGDRFSLEVTVDKDVMQVVALPDFRDGMIAPGIEIVGAAEPDTISLGGRKQRLVQRYDLTSFDAGTYECGRFPVLYGDKNIVDTLLSDSPLRITVGTLAVDPDKEAPHDIKEPEEAPLLVSEFGGWTVWGVVLAAVLAAAAILARRMLRRRKAKKSAPVAADVAVPPHERAIRDLEELHNRKLWQSGRVKQYYTALSDIMRRYLDGRYGIDAPEMTTDQIVGCVRKLSVDAKRRNDLFAILRTADLVKFARHAPGDEENEDHYTAAYWFVEETKAVEEETGSLAGDGNEA